MDRPEILEAEDLYGSCLVHSRVEILSLLKQSIQHRCRIDMLIPHTMFVFASVFLGSSTKGDRLYFDLPNDPVLKRYFSDAKLVVFAFELNGIKIQFKSKNMEIGHYQGAPCFELETPSWILRLQRRDYFRVIPLHASFAKSKDFSLPILDISAGGVALGWGTADDAPALHQVFPDVELHIQGISKFTIDLEVRNFVIPPTGKCRCGCAFVNLPGIRVQSIQQYVDMVQRERKI